MGIAMSFTMSLVGSLHGNIASGHFTVPGFISSFLVSFVIATIIAIAIGFIVPMKKINDNLEAKHNLKKGEFKTLLIESLVSDLIYTPLICLVMTIVSISLFALPNSRKGFEQELEGKKQALAGVEAQLEHETDGAKIGELKASQGELTGQIKGMEADGGPTFGRQFAKSFPVGLILDFVVALIVIMIIEPKFQKKAFQKFIPNYGEDIDADMV